MSHQGRALAIVAGGAGRLGSMVVRRLLASDHDVLVLDRVAPPFTAPGLHAHELDLTDETAVAAVRGSWPTPRVLVNCQGWSPKGGDGLAVPDAELTAAAFLEIVAANLLSCFLTLREFVPAMARAGGGRVVNVSSAAARTGRTPASPAYSAAKAGLDALTRSFAVRYGPANVIVCGVAPGKLVDSSWRDSDAALSQYRAEVPLGQLGRHEDAAELIAFLTSERNAHVTGQTVVLDGGRLA